MTKTLHRRPRNLRALRALPVVLILGLLVHLLLPRLDSIAGSLETLRSMAPWAVAMAVFMETLSYVANGALLQSIVGIAGQRISLGRAAAIEIGASTVALVAAGPVGFGAAVHKWTGESGVSADAAALSSWLPSMFDAVSMVLFAIVGGIELLLFHRLSRLTVVALAIVVSALSVAIAGAIVLMARHDWMKTAVRWASRLMKKVRRGWDDSGLIRAAESATEAWKTMRRGAWLRPSCCSLLVLTFDILCLRYAFLAARHSLPISFLLAGYGVPLLLGRASFIPGGVAVVEVAMAALFTGLGVPANAAVVAVLTYRLLSFWLPSLIGIPVAAMLQAR